MTQGPIPRRWSDLCTADFAALDPARTVALLPLGATEQHGPHLPLSVDAALADGLVASALTHLPADAPVLVLPTQTIGYSPEHLSFAGTLSLPAQTVIETWVAIGAAVARAGLRKLLLFNTHGGQVSLMDVAARELRVRHGLMVWRTSWFDLPLPDAVRALFSADEHRWGTHAGAIETAMMLALAPHTVRMDRAQAFDSSARGRAATSPLIAARAARLAWAVEDLNPAGAVGDARSATAAQGQALVDAVGRQLAALLGEIAALEDVAPVATPGDAAP